MNYFEQAAKLARQATCHKAKCGSVIVALDGTIIGEGYNAPPLNDESQRVCEVEWNLESKPKYDKTCCIHAEWNAILNACKTNPEKIVGATLYFMRINDLGEYTNAGDPYCTVCSRLALQSGIAYFSLWNNGEDRYDTKSYDKRSYQYHSLRNNK